MVSIRWLLAIPVALAATLLAAPADASSVRDSAKMFSRDVVRKAEARLESLERTTHIPVVIETIQEIAGLEHSAAQAARRKALDALAVHRDEAIHADGVYILISKREHLISHVLVRERYSDLLPIEKRDAIRQAFIEDFKQQNFDGGLMRAVETIEKSLHGVSGRGRAERVPARVPAPLQHGAAGRKAVAGGSTMGTFLLIVVGIFGVLLLLRLLGGLFGRSARPGMPGGMGMGRPGMGGGPGYYGGGYGGGGGGFMSSLFGGLGGALAGNWLYDQFTGRHGQVSSADTVSPPDYSAGAPDAGGDAIVGADDDPGGAASWDDPGGADTGGGDWGGGDAGGGGDWGGGGGDWGGGGDFGGGGGDW
jgi:uncharacterized membrane protein YgcG